MTVGELKVLLDKYSDNNPDVIVGIQNVDQEIDDHIGISVEKDGQLVLY